MRTLTHNEKTLHRDIHAACEFLAKVLSEMGNFENKFSDYVKYTLFIEKYYNRFCSNSIEDVQRKYASKLVISHILNPNLENYCQMFEFLLDVCIDSLSGIGTCNDTIIINTSRVLYREYINKHGKGYCFLAHKYWTKSTKDDEETAVEEVKKLLEQIVIDI